LRSSSKCQRKKPQPIPDLKPSTGHVPRVFHKDPNKSYQQVHSLTARSVSLKFRENLKKSQPDHTDINIKLKSSNVNGKPSNNSESTFLNENENEISNNRDISNGGGTQDFDPDSAPGELSRKKGGSSSNILARAAFWDKRVHEEIIDDKLVIKEFPKMEI